MDSAAADAPVLKKTETREAPTGIPRITLWLMKACYQPAYWGQGATDRLPETERRTITSLSQPQATCQNENAPA